MWEKITLLFFLGLLLFHLGPLAPQFQCCSVVAGAVAKKSVYFKALAPISAQATLKYGVRGGTEEQK